MKYLDLTGLQEMGRIFKAGLAGKAGINHSHTADAVAMTADDPTTVAEEIAALKEGSELTVVSSDPDTDGVYRAVTWTRRDGTTYAKSTLSGSPYNSLAVVYYGQSGATVDKTIAWAITIDSNGVVSRKELTNDPFLAPGPKLLAAGGMDQGYFGEVSTTELISGSALASMIGLTAGTAQYDTSPWVKSAIDGKVIYWAKKPFRHSISWDHISAAGAVDGSKVITIGDRQYRIRLFKGSTTNPSDSSGTAVHGSEFNRIILPTHEQAKTGSWAYPDNVGPGDAPNNWGINYSDDDLVFISAAGDGSYSWMQEVRTGSPTYRLSRGNLGVSYAGVGMSWSATAGYGWRPVLEVVS